MRFEVCNDCIVLVRIEVELFMADEMSENLFCSRHRKGWRRHLGGINKIAFSLLFFRAGAGTNDGLAPLI
jgi:hypothetical protein